MVEVGNKTMATSLGTNVLADDGKARCLPLGTLVYDPDVYTSLAFYSDSNCTKHLYYTARPQTCETLKVDWLYSNHSTDCGVTMYSIYRDGHIYEGDEVFYKSGDLCSDATASHNQYQFLDSLGTKQPPEIFAEVSVSLVE